MDTNHTDLVIKQEEDPLGNEFVEYIYTGEYNSHEEEDNLQKLDDDYDYEETDDSPVPKRSKLSTEDMANNSSNDNITQGYTKTNNSPTAETTNIKSTRLSKSQKDALIEFMRTHRDLVNSNKLDGKVNKYIDRHELWLLITNKLNKLGPPKHLHKWKKTWSDLRGQTKSKLERMDRTNNMEPLFRFLTEDDDRISAICGFSDRFKYILNHPERPIYRSGPICNNNKNPVEIIKRQAIVKSTPPPPTSVEIFKPIIKKIHQTTVTPSTTTGGGGGVKKLPTITSKLEKSPSNIPLTLGLTVTPSTTSTLQHTLEKLLKTQTEQTQLLRTIVEQNSRLLDQNRKFLKTLKIVDD